MAHVPYLFRFTGKAQWRGSDIGQWSNWTAWQVFHSMVALTLNAFEALPARGRTTLPRFPRS
jgi:hypothetical protein